MKMILVDIGSKKKREELKETIIRSRDLDRQKKIFLAWSSIAGDEWAF